MARRSRGYQKQPEIIWKCAGCAASVPARSMAHFDGKDYCDVCTVAKRQEYGLDEPVSAAESQAVHDYLLGHATPAPYMVDGGGPGSAD